jgi:hypothetical protein
MQGQSRTVQVLHRYHDAFMTGDAFESVKNSRAWSWWFCRIAMERMNVIQRRQARKMARLHFHVMVVDSPMVYGICYNSSACHVSSASEHKIEFECGSVCDTVCDKKACEELAWPFAGAMFSSCSFIIRIPWKKRTKLIKVASILRHPCTKWVRCWPCTKMTWTVLACMKITSWHVPMLSHTCRVQFKCSILKLVNTCMDVRPLVAATLRFSEHFPPSLQTWLECLRQQCHCRHLQLESLKTCNVIRHDEREVLWWGACWKIGNWNEWRGVYVDWCNTMSDASRLDYFSVCKLSSGNRTRK